MTSKRSYLIEDEAHAEFISEFPTLENALQELDRISAVPWGIAPNTPPCMTGLECSREYVLVEYEVGATPYKELKRKEMLEIDAKKINWKSRTF